MNDLAATYAAAPYEAFKVQCSLAMSGPAPTAPGEEYVMMFLDVSSAHLHSPVQRCIYVVIDGVVYLLPKALYGLRDAGAAFDRKVEDSLLQMGFALGKFSPCLAHDAGDTASSTTGLSPADASRVSLHGDDFVVLARRSRAEKLGVHLLLKCRGVLGPRPDLGDVAEVTHLNRLVRWVSAAYGAPGPERIEIEGDPDTHKLSSARLA